MVVLAQRVFTWVVDNTFIQDTCRLNYRSVIFNIEECNHCCAKDNNVFVQR